MRLTLERPDPDIVTAVSRSADLLRDGRGLLLEPVDRTEVRDAAAAWTGRVNTVTARTDRVDVEALLIRLCRLGLAHRPEPRRHHARHLVRPTSLSAVLTVVSGSLDRKSAPDKRGNPCRRPVMAVNAAPSGKAPPGRLRFGAATMAQATAFPAAASGSHADGSSAPPQPLRAGERFLDLRMTEAYTPAPPEGGGSDGPWCISQTDAARIPHHTNT
jgi:hypothetical protein